MKCPFCNLIKKEDLSLNYVSNSQIFYQSKNFFSVYNIKPILPGHSLIISKRHFKSFLGLKNNDVNELFRVIKKTVKALIKVYNSDGFDIAIQDGEVGGQSVEHFHIHIIPRKKGDIKGDPTRWFFDILKNESVKILSYKDMNKNVDKIKRAIK